VGCLEPAAQTDKPSEQSSTQPLTSRSESGTTRQKGRITIKVELNRLQPDVGQLTDDEIYEATVKLSKQVEDELRNRDHSGWNDMFDVTVPPNGQLTKSEVIDQIGLHFRVPGIKLMETMSSTPRDLERICSADGCYFISKATLRLQFQRHGHDDFEPWFEKTTVNGKTITVPVDVELMWAAADTWCPTSTVRN
jgi:hypothetical protein